MSQTPPDILETKKILLIEDDPEMRAFYKDYLSNIYSVDTAENGVEGFAKLKVGDYDLLVLDIMMPKMDGITFLTKKKEDSKISSVPVVMLTNLGNDEIIKQCFALGAKYYIFKAETTPDKILPTLQQAINSK